MLKSKIWPNKRIKNNFFLGITVTKNYQMSIKCLIADTIVFVIKML